MGKQDPTHRLTEFDLACEEKINYEKEYNTQLSYGNYSGQKEAGLLPDKWYGRINEVKKNRPKEFKFEALEYEEYRRRFHSKLSFDQYRAKRDSSKLSPKWKDFLEYINSVMPNDLDVAITEWLSYNELYHDNLTIFEYYEQNAEGKLPREWYDFLLQLDDTADELELSSMVL